MFSISDKIVHPIHGAGVIKEVIIKNIDNEDVKYYEVELVHSNMSIFIPIKTNLAIGIRHISSKEELEDIMENSKTRLQEFETNWNKRYRDNMIKIRTGEFCEVAMVAKSLASRSDKRALSTGEKKMLDSAKHILASEMSLSLEIDYEMAQQKLDILMENSEDFALST